MKTLLLKLAGPLQSWGTRSHFETRHTDLYPSKSAIIGILAASLGYRRYEDEKIKKLNQLKFVVRVDQLGRLLKDYHIAKKYKNDKEERTYVTNRYYLEDAIFVVAIGGDKDQIEEIEEALKNPYFQPFMGRRSVPLSADFFIGSMDGEIINCISELPWQASDWYKKKYKGEKYVNLSAYCDADLLKGEAIMYRKDKVESFSQRNRDFRFREESKFRIRVSNEGNKENVWDHDALGVLGGEDVPVTSGN